MKKKNTFSSYIPSDGKYTKSFLKHFEVFELAPENKQPTFRTIFWKNLLLLNYAKKTGKN